MSYAIFIKKKLILYQSSLILNLMVLGKNIRYMSVINLPQIVQFNSHETAWFKTHCQHSVAQLRAKLGLTHLARYLKWEV